MLAQCARTRLKAVSTGIFRVRIRDEALININCCAVCNARVTNKKPASGGFKLAEPPYRNL